MPDAAPDPLKLQLRIPRDLHALVSQFAAAEDRSLNGQLVAMLREAAAARQPRARKRARRPADG